MTSIFEYSWTFTLPTHYRRSSSCTKDPFDHKLPHLVHQLTNPATVDGLLPAKQQELVDSVGHHGLVGMVVWCYLRASPLLKQGRGRCQCCGARLEWRHIAEAGDRDHRLNQHKVLVMGVALLTHLSSCTTVLPVLDNIDVAWMNSILSRMDADWILQVLVQVWEGKWAIQNYW